MKTPSSPKKSSHFGAGLLAGAIMGAAAGLFLKSSKGKELTAEAQVKAKELQKKLMKKLKSAESLTKESYESLVEELMGHYETTKEIAKKDIPQIRTYMLKKWSEIKKQLDDVNDEE